MAVGVDTYFMSLLSRGGGGGGGGQNATSKQSSDKTTRESREPISRREAEREARSFDVTIHIAKMATISMIPRPSDETAATVGRPRRKRFSLAGLNLGSNSKASEKDASANNCHKNGSSTGHNREDRKTGTSTKRRGRPHQSPKTLTNAANGTANSTLPAATAVASRDPKARRDSLPIFDRTCTKEEPGDSRKGGKGDPLDGGSGLGDSAVASASAVAGGVGGEVTANTEFERRGPPRRRHSASATQIEAISRQAFGGGDAAAYESDSSDSSAWLDSDSDDED